MEDYDIEVLADQHWEETLDFLTTDMPPSEVDIKVLAERYRDYIKEMEEHHLSVSATAIRVCSALLSMKAAVTLEYEEEEETEEEEPNPMDFEEEEIEEPERTVELRKGPELEMPPKPKPKRRMHKDELKDALRNALEVKEKREERQREREEMDQQFELNEEETIRQKINSLYSRVTDMVSGNSEKVKFEQLLEQRTSEERIEKFMHVLTLENDQKVTCKQEEFLGDLHVTPEGDEEAET